MLLRLASLPGRMANTSISSSVKQILQAPRLVKPSNNNVLVRNYARGPRETVTRGEVKRGPTLKERLMAPPSANGMTMNRGCII